MEVTAAFVFGLVWAAMIAALFFAFGTQANHRRLAALPRLPSMLATIIFLLTVLVRLVPAIVYQRGADYDIESFRIVGHLILQGIDIYQAPDAAGRHPYLPFQLYAMALGQYLAEHTPLPFVVLIKLPAILADGAIAALLYVASRRLYGIRPALLVGMLAMVNPVSLLVSAYHGQFDSVPVVFALLSWYWFRFKADDTYGRLIAGLFLGLAILDKSWPVLFLPVLLLRLPGIRPKALFSMGVAVPPTLGILLYLALFPAALRPILDAAVGYDAVVGWWGYTAALNALKGWAERNGHLEIREQAAAWLGYADHYGKYLTLLALGMVYLIQRRAEDAINGFLTTLLVFVVFTAGFGVQYLTWLVPVALLARQIRSLQWYVAASVLFLGFTYFTHLLTTLLLRVLDLPREQGFLQLLSLPVWLVALAWLIDQLRQRWQPVRAATIQPNMADTIEVSRN